MSRWQSPWLEWALMVFVSAFLFVEFFRLNSYLFDFLEHARGINWVFLPAGFRVLLVLVLGLPGATGIALGSYWLNLERFEQPHLLSSLAICLASGFGPWIVKYAMEKRGLLGRDLQDISSSSLLQFVFFYAVVNAISHQGIFWGFGLTDSKPWVDIWPMFVGDTVGALLVLYTFKLGLRWLRSRLRPGA